MVTKFADGTHLENTVSAKNSRVGIKENVIQSLTIQSLEVLITGQINKNFYNYKDL